MSDQDQERKAPLKLSQPGKLELKKTVESGQVRQSFSHGRSKVVTVEVKKKRTFTTGAAGSMHEVREGVEEAPVVAAAPVVAVPHEELAALHSSHDLTNQEKQARVRALQDAKARVPLKNKPNAMPLPLPRLKMLRPVLRPSRLPNRHPKLRMWLLRKRPWRLLPPLLPLP